MQAPPLPENEAERLRILQELQLLGTPAEDKYDRLSRLAAEVFDIPVVLINLAGENTLWCKSRVGLDIQEVDRNTSFCAYTVYHRRSLVVPDLTLDERFCTNPLVTDGPQFRFYGGVPLSLDGEHVLGTLCLIDYRPREFSAGEVRRMEVFGRQVEELLRLHQQTLLLMKESLNSQYRSAHYQALIQGAAAGIVRIDGRGRILEINDFALTMLGYRREELEGQKVETMMPEPWASAHDRYLQSFLQTGDAKVIGVGREVEAQHRDGSVIPVHLAVSQIQYEGEDQKDRLEFMGVLTNLTETRRAQQAEQEERILLRSLIEASRDPIYARDCNGRYLIANQASLRLLGHSVEGGNEALSLCETEREVMQSGEPVVARHSDEQGTQFEISHSPLKDAHGRPRGVVSVAHNVTDLYNLTTQLERQQKLLSVLHRGLTDYQALLSGNSLWNFLMEALRELTNSDYALIGELDPDSAEPALKIHAITDLSWSDESRHLMAQLTSGNMTLTNPDTLLGRVFAGGETVLSNDLDRDGRLSRFPPGHPHLYRYLGVPIYHQGRLLGMFAIANGRDPYDEALAEWLEPFTSTCALLINLYRQLDERARITEQLRVAGEEAERASRAKSEFLSSMSHELRTPLNAILGFAQLLQSGRQPLTERQARQTEQIYRSGKHLLELINEVLDLARIESGRITLSLEAIRISDVVRDALEILSPIAQQNRIRISIEPGSCEGFWVTADYTRLKQVLINLISNAIKYNREGGQVLLDCEQQDGRLQVNVRDTGPGIAADNLPHLFEPFNRLGAESGPVEGTGIGLALTRQLVTLMQGEIGVRSEEGVGSEFWFTLPLAEEQSSSAADGDGRVPAAAADSQRSRILYIEDNPANQRLMEDIFDELDDCRLDVAHSAELGLELACSAVPDLILMDIDLPGMDGFQAQQLLSRNPLTRHIPVVAVSAGAQSGNIRRAQQAGFAGYLTKPVDIPLLLETVRRLLREGDV